MKKIEFVYREILYHSIEKKNKTLTQLGLSKSLHISLSTVNLALKPLIKMNAIKINQRNFEILDCKKIIYYWASIRNLEKDIIYSTRTEKSVRQTESEMPNNAIFTAYTAYKFKYQDVPADYSEIYVYAETNEIIKRFPKNDKRPNLFVLAKDEVMQKYGKPTTAQIFVDLWNLKQWYAKDFLKAMEEKMHGILE